jgi:transcriptional regulator with XRE-family HTH domain
MLTSVSETGKCQFRPASANLAGEPLAAPRFVSVMLQWTPTERGVAGVPTTGSSPTIRRHELGVWLRTLRIEKGWTVDQVASRLEVSSSKVSRLETGQRGVREKDIRLLCDLYELDAEQRQRLTELARAGRQRAQWQPRGLDYSTYIELEAEAVSISDYGLGIMPGLLQTSDYARAVVRAAVPRWVPEIVKQRVDGRMVRQQLLFAEHPPHFEAVVDESVLHRVVGSPAVMRGQLERLLLLADLPRVSLRVIPYAAGALPAGNNKFIILRFAQPDVVPDVVFIEGLTRHEYLKDPHEVEVYNMTFRTLLELAASPDATREMITAMLATYRGRPS